MPEEKERPGNHTVKQLREWLDQFPEDCKVSYEMDCFHGRVTLAVSNGEAKISLAL